MSCDHYPFDASSTMTDSVLYTIKSLLGYRPDYNAFDAEIITYINAYVLHLKEIGMKIPNGFVVRDASATWQDMLTDESDFESAKTFIYIKVKLIHDPPATSFVIEALNKAASEIEWRLNARCDDAFEKTWKGDENE